MQLITKYRMLGCELNSFLRKDLCMYKLMETIVFSLCLPAGSDNELLLIFNNVNINILNSRK